MATTLANRLVVIGLQTTEWTPFSEEFATRSVAMGIDIPLSRLSPGDRLAVDPKRENVLLLIDLDLIGQLDETGWFAGKPERFGWHLGLLSRAETQWIAVTARPEVYTPWACQLGGAVQHLVRPIDPSVVTRWIIRHFRKLADGERLPTRGLNSQGHLLCVAHAMQATLLLKLISTTGQHGQIAIARGEIVSASINDGEPNITSLKTMLDWSCQNIQGVTLFRDQSMNLLNIPFDHLFDTQPATKVSTPTEVCRNLVESTPDSLACAVVNLATGLIVASHHVPSYLTQAYLDALAAAAVDMFRGRNVKRIEDMLSKARGTPVKDTFEEITITTAGTHHFMKAIRDRNLLVVMVTKPTPNAVPIWSKLRIAIPEILAAH